VFHKQKLKRQIPRLKAGLKDIRECFGFFGHLKAKAGEVSTPGGYVQKIREKRCTVRKRRRKSEKKSRRERKSGSYERKTKIRKER